MKRLGVVLLASLTVAACGGGGDGGGRSWVSLPGLETVTVWLTAFDQKGARWAGTSDGLYRWDPPATAGTNGWTRVISESTVNTIETDPTTDGMYVGSPSALHYVAGDGTPTLVSDLAAAGLGVGTGTLAVDGDGRVLLIGYGFATLRAFARASGTWSPIAIDPAVSPANLALTRIIRGPSGDIWTGEPGNLFRLARGSEMAVMVETCGSRPNDCPELLQSPNGKLYGGVLNDITGYHALWGFDEATGTVTTELARLPATYPNSGGMAVDSDDTIYLSGNTDYTDAGQQDLLKARAGGTASVIATFPGLGWSFDVLKGRIVANQAQSGVWELE